MDTKIALKEADSELPLQAVIGFNGSVPRGLVLHPDDEHLIFPLGSTVVVRNLLSHTQYFLQKGGHDSSVCCLALSPSGKYLASGQETHAGFPAHIVVWNMETLEAEFKLTLHKGKVQDLSFSCNDKYLASVGGLDDNRVIVWDLKSGNGICAGNLFNTEAKCLEFLHNDPHKFVVGGRYGVQVWQFERTNRKINPTNCNLGPLKRTVLCMAIDEKDEMLYCGTETGDVLQVGLEYQLFKQLGPKKRPFSLGVHSIIQTNEDSLVIGTGDGLLVVMSKEDLKMKLGGEITSLQLNAKGDHFFASTHDSNIYLVHLESFEYELRTTCHNGPINDIAFAANYSELFATCSGPDIRVWHATKRHELLRIRNPNVECLCVAFSTDGKSILSGWSDGKIRAFLPQSGKLNYVINDAHVGGVTTLVSTKDSKFIVSGGMDGQVRVWLIQTDAQKMVASMKEHKTRVNCIQLSEDDHECISSSSDGSCIVWNLDRYVRANAIFGSTQFRAALYHPDQSQYLTTGTDRKITFWDAADAEPIRILDGGVGEINSLDISTDGEVFVSGGNDRVLWGYDDGVCYLSGNGHSGVITKVKIAPNQEYFVSVGTEGAVFIWEMVSFSPEEQ